MSNCCITNVNGLWLGYHSILQGVSPLITGNYSGDHLNPYERIETEFWDIGTLDGDVLVEFNYSTAQAVDYIGTYRCDLSGAQLDLEYFDGNDWVLLQNIPAEKEPYTVRFDTVTSDKWRLKISGTGSPVIGLVMIGESYDIDQQSVGWSSPVLAQDVKHHASVTDKGLSAGSSIVRRGYKFKLTGHDLSPLESHLGRWHELKESLLSGSIFIEHLANNIKQSCCAHLDSDIPQGSYITSNTAEQDIKLRGSVKASHVV